MGVQVGESGGKTPLLEKRECHIKHMKHYRYCCAPQQLLWRMRMQIRQRVKQQRWVLWSTVPNEWPPEQNDEKANSEKERDLTERLVLC